MKESKLKCEINSEYQNLYFKLLKRSKSLEKYLHFVMLLQELSKENNIIIESNEYFAAIIGISISAVERFMSRAEKEGYIVRDVKIHNVSNGSTKSERKIMPTEKLKGFEVPIDI